MNSVYSTLQLAKYHKFTYTHRTKTLKNDFLFSIFNRNDIGYMFLNYVTMIPKNSVSFLTPLCANMSRQAK